MKLKFLITSIFLATNFFTTTAQTTLEKAPENWFNLEQKKDNVPGIASEKAYNELLKGKKSQTIIVAVIDSGIDVNHEDLKDVIWNNSAEIAGNGVDDDKNGYVDDIHGWSFIGGKNGNVEKDTYEITREYGRLLKKYEGMSEEKKEKDAEFEYFNKIEKEYKSTVDKMKTRQESFMFFYKSYKKAKVLIEAYADTDSLTESVIADINSCDDKIKQAKGIMEYGVKNNVTIKDLEDGYNYYDTGLNYGYNLDYNPRNIIGDDYSNIDEKYYGSSDVIGVHNFHGTHVAGIIAANRQNNTGIKGVADNVRIMALRAVPNGDERDKDIANAIIYAVDNGARVINMSFGKSYSPGKAAVDSAVKYAASKNVLLVHAAGNSSKDSDKGGNFPTKKLIAGTSADNWLEVGASSWKGGKNLAANFSNYGKTTVDVFAPGVAIYSTAPDQKYKEAQGTSMASPVTAGVAAMIMSYYPKLTAVQVKDIIMQSTVKYKKLKVSKPGSKEEKIKFSALSKTGGVVNAYEAIKLAEKFSKGKLKIKKY